MDFEVYSKNGAAEFAVDSLVLLNAESLWHLAGELPTLPSDEAISRALPFSLISALVISLDAACLSMSSRRALMSRNDGLPLDLHPGVWCVCGQGGGLQFQLKNAFAATINALVRDFPE